MSTVQPKIVYGFNEGNNKFILKNEYINTYKLPNNIDIIYGIECILDFEDGNIFISNKQKKIVNEIYKKVIEYKKDNNLYENNINIGFYLCLENYNNDLIYTEYNINYNINDTVIDNSESDNIDSDNIDSETDSINESISDSDNSNSDNSDSDISDSEISDSENDSINEISDSDNSDNDISDSDVSDSKTDSINESVSDSDISDNDNLDSDNYIFNKIIKKKSSSPSPSPSPTDIDIEDE